MEEPIHTNDDIPIQDRLLLRIIDIRARATPERTYAYLPKGLNLADGFYPLSYAAFAKAIDAAAWWMDEMLGRVSGEDFPPLAYMGVNDLRYVVLTYASIKTHRRFMIPLLSNTAEAQVRLLKQHKCNNVLASRGRSHLWDPARAAIEDFRVVEVPELSQLITDAPVEHYPYTKTFDQAKDDPTWTIQTSGTTGNPKPLDYTNKTSVLTLGANEDGEHIAAMPNMITDCRFVNLLPLSWGAGLTAVIAWPILFGTTPVVLPETMPQPLTADYVAEAIDLAPRGRKNGIIFVPDVLRAFAADGECLRRLGRFDWVGYAGAPLDFPTGDAVSRLARVQSFMGATDVGAYPLLLNDAADWKIHRFHPTWLRFSFEHFQDDLYELCVGRMEDDPRPCFTADPSLRVYHTKDLWRKAPGRGEEDGGYWMTAGRIDDFVKLASLTKFNAIQIEQVLDRHPAIEKTVVAGEGRNRPFALVQLGAPTIPSRDGVLDEIWPAFEEANSLVNGEAQLTRPLVIFTDPSMPLKRTAKGTVDRRNTIKMYESQIEAMYGATDARQNGYPI